MKGAHVESVFQLLCLQSLLRIPAAPKGIYGFKLEVLEMCCWAEAGLYIALDEQNERKLRVITQSKSRNLCTS